MVGHSGAGLQHELCDEAAWCWADQWVSPRLKAVRFALIALPGRVMRHARKLIIRLARGHPSYEC